MRIFIILLLLLQSGIASTYTLQRILLQAAEHNDLSKAINQERLSLEAQSIADRSSNPLEFYGEGTRAITDENLRGNEYAIGLSQEIILPNIQELERSIDRLRNEAYLIDASKSILSFSNRLKNLYHQHCIDMRSYRGFGQSYEDFLNFYKKKEKAYKYQEISRTELMQIATEKHQIYAKLQSLKMEQEISKQTLLTLGSINYTETTQLACNDIYPIEKNVTLYSRFKLSKDAHQKRLQSTQEKIERYKNNFDAINLSAQYTNEIDMEKYTVGVSIPLNFTSKKYEQEKVAAMHKRGAMEHQYDQEMRQKEGLYTQLRLRLKSLAMMIGTYQQNYKNYKNSVLPLIQTSYDLGETSILEYLLSKQKLYKLNEEIYSTQKRYYDALFKLYTISEQKDTQ